MLAGFLSEFEHFLSGAPEPVRGGNYEDVMLGALYPILALGEWSGLAMIDIEIIAADPSGKENLDLPLRAPLSSRSSPTWNLKTRIPTEPGRWSNNVQLRSALGAQKPTSQR